MNESRSTASEGLMRVGAIGVGGHASGTLYPLLPMTGLKLVATCARHRDRAESAASRWGAKHAFDDADRMLSSVDLDGVIVCVPTPEYRDLVRLCLERGTPVFCEKPGASSALEAADLASLSASTGIPIVVGYMKRFAPAYQRAQGIVGSADFGGPSLGAFTFAMGPLKAYENLRTYLIDGPVHHLDLARYFFGELTDIRAQIARMPTPGFAIAVSALASSGAVCTFNFCTTASWSQRSEHVEIFGDGHAVWVENVDTCVYRPAQAPEQVWRPNYSVSVRPRATGFLGELEHFRQVVMRDAENSSDMKSAAGTLKIAEQLCDSLGV